MAIIGLVALIALIGLALASLPKGYRCSECGHWEPDRQGAAGHQALHAMHRMPL